MAVNAYIDGGYMRHKCTDAIRRVFEVNPELDFTDVRNLLQVDRVFYYDCVEDQPKPNESVEDFEKRLAVQQRFLDTIHRAPMCHVRLGTIKPKQGRKPISQKEVDVKMAVDMLTEAADGKMDRAILVAGDLDFRPVVESLVHRFRIVVEVWYDASGIAEELVNAADIRHPIVFDEWMWFLSYKFKDTHRKPNIARDQGVRASVINKGRLADGKIITIVEGQQVPYLIHLEDGLALVGDNVKVLKNYFELKYGHVEWGGEDAPRIFTE